MDEFISGCIAGSMGIIATQPMDTVRIRLATQTSKDKNCYGIKTCIYETFKKEGMRGLYKGLASPLFTMGFMNACLFLSFEKTLDLIYRGKIDYIKNEQCPLWSIMVAGLVSGFPAGAINAPTELVKCIAQVNRNNKGYINEEWIIFIRLLKRGGFSKYGIGRGFSLTCLRDFISYGIYFLFYEYICRKFGGKNKMVTFLAGGTAGATAWASIYPLECLKSRWQVSNPIKNTKIFPFFRKQIELDGYSFLGRGFLATMCRAWPQNGVIFLVYEFCYSYLNNKSV